MPPQVWTTTFVMCRDRFSSWVEICRKQQATTWSVRTEPNVWQQVGRGVNNPLLSIPVSLPLPSLPSCSTFTFHFTVPNSSCLHHNRPSTRRKELASFLVTQSVIPLLHFYIKLFSTRWACNGTSLFWKAKICLSFSN